MIACITDVPVFDLRRARASDYEFVTRLYQDTMQPLLTRLDAWDERDALLRFKRYFKVRETQIVGLDGEDIGFLQVSETRNKITLAQIHIAAQFRGRGIGTHLVQSVLRDAATKRMPVLLSVVRGNHARALYERLGFRVTGEDATRLHMEWESAREPAMEPQALNGPTV